MKKILLFVLALGVGFATIAQQAYKFKLEPDHHKRSDKPALGIEPIKDASLVNAKPISKKITPPSDRDIDIVTVIDIGSGANAWSYGSNNSGNQRSMVWAEPELNAVINFHRMGGALDTGNGYSGDLGYDLSLDGGMTWTVMNECYVAVDNAGGEYYLDAARYPNAGIYNPTGNIADARVTFFTPNLDATNTEPGGTGWGGYSFGAANISNPSDTTGNYNRKSSHDDVFQYIPDNFDVTSQGLAVVVDVNADWTSGAYVYGGGLNVNMGYFDDDTQDFIYEETLFEFPDDGPYHSAVAFSPDGMTGYIAMLNNNGETWAVEGMPNIYPIYWKTTDGGETWSDPVAIQIDGPDGIGGIVNYALTDEQIASLYEEPLPARDEIPYTFLGDFDIAVTADGNLHVAGIVAPAGEAEEGISFFVADGMGAQMDLFSKDGGMTWEVETMGRIRRYEGTFGDMIEANRTQITLNPAANVVFVSWLDTDLEDEEDNSRPNIWCRGFRPADYMLTADANGEPNPTNVTNFSAGMWQSYLGTAAKTALELSPGEFTVPYVYVEMDPTDPGLPVMYKYIQDFKFTSADWIVTGVEDKFEEKANNVVVSQNYPNPFNGNSNVIVELTKASQLSLEVYTITGQQVAAKDYGYKTAGTTTLTIDGHNLTPGVYFYTVKAGENKVTRKMIVD